MKNYKCILFDLDGTLANTFPGILHSYQYAAEKIGLPLPTEQIVGEVIGAPLADVFRKKFGLSEDILEKALYYYRKYYAENGLHEVKQYDGMSDTLAELKKRGYLLGVTTLKKESFAKDILSDLELAHYFDVIIGMDDKDVLTKSGMIKKAMEQLCVSESETLLVGDSSYDAIGAEEVNVSFIAVTYGFGFHTKKDIEMYKCVGVIGVPEELKVLMKCKIMN